MSITWTERERPRVARWERAVQRALWTVRTHVFDVVRDFSGWRWNVYRLVARVEERWSRHLSQADLHLTACPRCERPMMHVILRPGADARTNRKVCFGCQLETPHPSEH